MSEASGAVHSVQAVQQELGADVASMQAPGQELAGQRIELSLRPRDGAELASCLRALSEHEQPVVVTGGCTRMGLGNRLGDVAGVLSTERLSGIVEFDEQDGVLQAMAGTRVSEVAAAVVARGWELPVDPPGGTTTIGGAIATAATGPRRHHYGPLRRSILGLDVVLASGERTRCGGRVVKNVTGYDLAKLYAGSLGTLGVIESAWLRLRPAPEETRTLVAVFASDASGRAFALGLEAARRDSVRAAALVSGAPAAELGAPTGHAAGCVLVVECAGDPGSVARDADWLVAETGARAVPEEARLLGRLRELQGSGRLRARLAVLPSKLSRTLTPLADAGFGVIVYPGAGFVYAVAEDVENAEALATVDAVASDVCADLLIEAIPDEARGARDVFGDPGAAAPLLRSLKERFDPHRILNPGRGQGFR